MSTVLDTLGWEWTTLPVIAASPSATTGAAAEKTTTTTTTIHLLTSPLANKRHQILHALPQILTPILLLADDDVLWPPRFLPHILAPFSLSPAIGAVGPTITLLRPSSSSSSDGEAGGGFGWCDFLGTAYLLRWRFNLLAAAGLAPRMLPCLSGRTCAIRTGILQDPRFAHAYAHEFFDVGFGGFGGWGWGWLLGGWGGQKRVHLDKVDDDNFVTRWLAGKGWEVRLQSAREAEVRTALRRDWWGFVGQCVRWARTTWRSNWTSLRGRDVAGYGVWGWYAVLASSFNPPAVVMEGVLWWLLLRACGGDGEGGGCFCFWGTVRRKEAMVEFAVWVFLTKTVKLWGHFWRHPRDLMYLPASIAFGYFHGLIKIWTLMTIHWTTWEGGKEEVPLERDAASRRNEFLRSKEWMKLD